MKATPTNPQENIWLWLGKIFSGMLLLFLLGLHFVVNHLVAPEGLLSYADVILYYKNPVIPIIEGLFLITVTGHALVGLRGIILDLNPSPKTLKGIDYTFTLVGIIAIGYGIWLLWTVASL